MAELIKERELVTKVEYWKEYSWKDNPSAGFSFPCDEKGNIEVTPYNCENIKIAEIKTKSGELIFMGVNTRECSFYTPAIYKCHCGRKVEVEGDTKCKCGQWYNAFGQELVDNWFENPSCYDEEVGDLF